MFYENRCKKIDEKFLLRLAQLAPRVKRRRRPAPSRGRIERIISQLLPTQVDVHVSSGSLKTKTKR